MSTIEVFEPALCCNTGVCGDDVDQALITFTADLDWVASNGGTITRHNLANDPPCLRRKRHRRSIPQNLRLRRTPAGDRRRSHRPDRYLSHPQPAREMGRHHRSRSRGRAGRDRHARTRRRLSMLLHRRRRLHHLLLKAPTTQ